MFLDVSCTVHAIGFKRSVLVFATVATPAYDQCAAGVQEELSRLRLRPPVVVWHRMAPCDAAVSFPPFSIE